MIYYQLTSTGKGRNQDVTIYFLENLFAFTSFYEVFTVRLSTEPNQETNKLPKLNIIRPAWPALPNATASAFVAVSNNYLANWPTTSFGAPSNIDSSGIFWNQPVFVALAEICSMSSLFRFTSAVI